MDTQAWQSMLIPDAAQPDDKPAVWELFHENSKTTRYSAVVPDEAVASRMERMHPSLPYRGHASVDLPALDEQPSAGAGRALRDRRSRRELAPVSIPLAHVAALLESAYGVTATNEDNGFPRPFRAAPSGGALYPLELYVVVAAAAGLAAGLYHFDPGARRLHCLDAALSQTAVADAFVQRDVVLGSSVVVLLGALFERSVFKYGERGYRFVLLEAGHVAQNLTLAATGLGYASVCLGGYFDHEVDELLGFDGVTLSTVYAVAVGGMASR